jgi:hypothetical protein
MRERIHLFFNENMDVDGRSVPGYSRALLRGGWEPDVLPMREWRARARREGVFIVLHDRRDDHRMGRDRARFIPSAVETIAFVGLMVRYVVYDGPDRPYYTTNSIVAKAARLAKCDQRPVSITYHNDWPCGRYLDTIRELSHREVPSPASATEVFASGPILCALRNEQGMWSEYHIHCGTATAARRRARYYCGSQNERARARLFERLRKQGEE